MDSPHRSLVRGQLLDRRTRLEAVLTAMPGVDSVARLLRDVDEALDRIENGTYGICETCHDPVEEERLLADPLCRTCLDHLTTAQQRALEQDLDLAARIQGALLPGRSHRAPGWEAAYHYEGAGPVSGDYCDLLDGPGGDLHFAVGDISGKGVAASMLMAHLHATFRALVPLGLPLDEVVARASRSFCESTLPSHYATLACGRCSRDGRLQICSAGHLPPLVIGADGVRWIEAGGMPIGIACDETYAVRTAEMAPGDVLLLYTDGLSEMANREEEEYGRARLAEVASARRALAPPDLIAACLADANAFRNGAPRRDDLTLMAIRRAP